MQRDNDTVGTTETVTMTQFDSLHAATDLYKLPRDDWPQITVTRQVGVVTWR